MNPSSIKSLYCVLVRYTLEYGSHHLSSVCGKRNGYLELVQNRFHSVIVIFRNPNGLIKIVNHYSLLRPIEFELWISQKFSSFNLNPFYFLICQFFTTIYHGTRIKKIFQFYHRNEWYIFTLNKIYKKIFTFKFIYLFVAMFKYEQFNSCVR